MIEFISASRCTACNICVHACPTHVFDSVEGGAPRIARPDACQTCFMCELYCPEDALYVAPQAGVRGTIDEAEATARGLLGSYRRAIGWGEGRVSRAGADQSHELLKKTA